MENEPVGSAGRLDGVADSDKTSGGGGICVVTVAVGALRGVSLRFLRLL